MSWACSTFFAEFAPHRMTIAADGAMAACRSCGTTVVAVVEEGAGRGREGNMAP
jgi:hypothetical protein